MTKKQARERKAAWNQAIREGRMVRFEAMTHRASGFNFKAYATVGDAETAVATFLAVGLVANIVPKELAQ